MKHLPAILIFARLLSGIVILALAFFNVDSYNILAVILFSFGLLTDVFDGIIARRLNISTQKLRRLDSTTDQLFFIMIAVGTEVLAYIICFIKFKKEIATHSIASKIWTLVLFAALLQIISTGDSTVLYQICFYAGMLTRLEIIGIILLLRKWTNDVPSIYHAVLLRNGKPVKRHKLFNG
jgi:CDP-diacylglycerol--glycerol-3-phosphate 3-phosphatidyltransferase